MENKDLNRIKMVLVEKHRTSKWLSEQLGKDPTTVSKWCTNQSQPTLEILLKIAELLEVNYAELVRQNSKFNTSPNTKMSEKKEFLRPDRQSLDELLELQAERKKTEDIAAWRLMKLHNRLLTKHHETFWIEVENEINDGKEYFRYKQVEHTKNPNVGQFDVLLEQNLITVDLLLCRPSGNGDTYSFKIKKKGMPLLFPESITYNI